MVRTTIFLCIFFIHILQAVHSSTVTNSEKISKKKSSNMVLTIPKTGTNLIQKCIKLIQSQHDDYSLVEWHHCWQASNNDELTLAPTQLKVDRIISKNQNVVLILRDPRDLITALGRCGHASTPPELIDNIIFEPGSHLSRVTCNSQFFLKYTSFAEAYHEYLQWEKYPFVYITRFEDLVGPFGGGDEPRQIQEILNIANHIQKPLTYDQACSVASELFGSTPTFKQGQIQDWKIKFSEENLDNFELINGNLVEGLGY